MTAASVTARIMTAPARSTRRAVRGAPASAFRCEPCGHYRAHGRGREGGGRHAASGYESRFQWYARSRAPERALVVWKWPGRRGWNRAVTVRERLVKETTKRLSHRTSAENHDSTAATRHRP